MRKGFLPLFLLWTTCIISFAQSKDDKDAAIEISNKQRTKTSLPFDRPFTIKYDFDVETKVFGVRIEQIKRGNEKTYYAKINTSDGKWEDRDKYTQARKVDDDELFSWEAVNGKDGTNVYIYINGFEGNRFYDIRILRNPAGDELDDYFELFRTIFQYNLPLSEPNYRADNGATFKSTAGYSLFEAKLKSINAWKTPFEHLSVAGPDAAGTLDVFHLLRFYNDRGFNAKYVSWNNEVDDTKKALKKKLITSEIASFELISGQEDDWPDFTVGESLATSSTNFDFDTRTGFAVTPDFGYIAYGFQKDINGFLPYLGAQVEFKYFDKNIPFNLITKKTTLHYLSFSTGVTLSSIAKYQRRSDFFSGKSLLVGIGIRLSSAVRITTGSLLFNKLDPNPTIDKKTLGGAYFVGLSIDLRLKSLLGDASQIFGNPITNTK